MTKETAVTKREGHSGRLPSNQGTPLQVLETRCPLTKRLIKENRSLSTLVHTKLGLIDTHTHTNTAREVGVGREREREGLESIWQGTRAVSLSSSGLGVPLLTTTVAAAAAAGKRFYEHKNKQTFYFYQGHSCGNVILCS